MPDLVGRIDAPTYTNVAHNNGTKEGMKLLGMPDSIEAGLWTKKHSCLSASDV